MDWSRLALEPGVNQAHHFRITHVHLDRISTTRITHLEELATVLPWITGVVWLLWEAGPQTGKFGSPGVSQRFRLETVDSASDTAAADRLDLPLSGRSRVLPPSVVGQLREPRLSGREAC